MDVWDQRRQMAAELQTWKTSLANLASDIETVFEQRKKAALDELEELQTELENVLYEVGEAAESLNEKDWGDTEENYADLLSRLEAGYNDLKGRIS